MKIRPLSTTFLPQDAAREGAGIGPELIVVRRAHDNIGVELKVDWEALMIFCEDRQQAFLMMESLRNAARLVGARTWGAFGRKWKKAKE